MAAEDTAVAEQAPAPPPPPEKPLSPPGFALAMTLRDLEQRFGPEEFEAAVRIIQDGTFEELKRQRQVALDQYREAKNAWIKANAGRA